MTIAEITELRETPAVRIDLVDRRERLARLRPHPPGSAFCPNCWEPLVHRPDPHPRIIPQYGSSNWKHARTGSCVCNPTCDAGSCDQPGTVAIGQQEWNGRSMQFVNQNFLCERHHAEYRKAHLLVEFVR